MNTKISFDQRWAPTLDWETPAGRLLDRLVAALPGDHAWRIVVFGSAPLQLALDPGFLSADVDIIPLESVEEFCGRAGLLEGQTSLYLECCSFSAFSASPDWWVRAAETQRKHVTFILPHPIDILVSKIKRLEEKDLNAFRLVRAKTGHPTEEELLMGLRRVVDIYRPSFEEESSGDPRHNTRVLWRELFGQSVDVAQQIIAPALAERRRHHGGDNYGLREALGRYGS